MSSNGSGPGESSPTANGADDEAVVVGMATNPGELVILMSVVTGDQLVLSKQTISYAAMGGIESPSLDLIVRRRASEMLGELRGAVDDLEDPVDS